MAGLRKLLPFFTPADTSPLYPKSVIIETTNACNLRCKMCHVWGEGVKGEREVGFISEELWKSALDELSLWDAPITVALHGAGEPLLHRDFLKILAYGASKKNLTVGFLSNGSLWTEELTRDILQTGVAWIGFSVDGAEPEKYRNYRGTDLEKIEGVIETLLKERKNKKPTVFLNMVALPDLDPERFIERWVDKVDEVKVSKYRPVGHRDFLTEQIERTPCYLLDEMLVMAWNGKVVLCCEDIWAEEVVGRFPGQSLAQIWHSARYERIRKLHKKRRYRNIGICAACDTWSNTFFTTEIDESRRLRIVRSAAQTCYTRIDDAPRQ